MIEVIGNPPREIVEWAEEMGFEGLVYNVSISYNEDVEEIKSFLEKKSLFINVWVAARLIKPEHEWFVSEIETQADFKVQLSTGDYLFNKSLRIIGLNGTGFSIDLDTGSVAFNIDRFEDFLEIKKSLEAFLKGLDVFVLHSFKLELMKPILKFEIPDDKELDQRLAVMLSKYKAMFDMRIQAEVVRRTAELEAKNNELKYKIARLQEQLNDQRKEMFNNIRSILKTVSRGWKLVESDTKLYLFYPKEIKPSTVIHKDGILKIPEDENPFFVKGILIPIEDEVVSAFAVAAFHPNVNPDSCMLRDFNPPRRVYAICLGDLKNKPFHEIAEHLINTLSSINLLSAFAGRAEEKAMELVERHKDKNDEDWEVV